jgi:hypothetical protein
MATQGSQKHSKTLENNQVKIFSTLTSTLEFARARTADLCFLAAEVGKNRMLPLRQRRSKQSCAQFTWALWGLIQATRFATRKFSWMRVLSDIACRSVQISPRIRKPVLYRAPCCERLLPLRKKRQYLFATRKSRKCDDPLVVAKSLVCAIEGQWSRKLARNKWPHSAALVYESKI